ncbi:MAG: bifunctional GNAT family N-acetyltransferase/acetate--CoA ligase family protein, partial [Dehalococcoidia bacterium]|nr:bifunctional GNAT family N-acetyltransferase/acetate--CoA ligase family protein [Dehalococcoidia bacterium]
ADEEKLIAFFNRLSKQTIYLRFHHVITHMSKEEARQFCTVDYQNTFAMVGTLGEDAEERIIAVGRYARQPGDTVAQIAFEVEDKYQGLGIGSHLLDQLAFIARDKRITKFEAEVLSENREMMNVLVNSGFTMHRQMQGTTYLGVLDLATTPIVEQKSMEREKVASIASLRTFLNPKSVAVIGASRRPNTIGNFVFRNLIQQDFKGVIYPVNPKAESIAAIKAYASVLDIQGDVDLAIIITPAETVQHIVEECARKGVKGIVVLSSGFADTGPEGLERQNRLLKTVRSYGMRLLGPNCMGLVNTNPAVNLNATFSYVFPPHGNIAFATQSGVLGSAILMYSNNLNIGLSTFVSIGNRADISSNELMQYWEDDPETDVVLLYLETFGNPRKFTRIARSITAKKPVVAVTSASPSPRARTSTSETGAIATDQAATEALFKQAGILRVDTLEDLFDTGSLLANQPLPAGNRVAIISNAGGPALLTAEACRARGLEVPALTDNTITRLKSILPARANLSNPIDTSPEFSIDQYKQSLELLREDVNVDIVVAIFIPPILSLSEEFAAVIREVAPAYRDGGKPLVTSFLGLRGTRVELGFKDKGYVPSFAFPESTAGALSRALQFSERLKKPVGIIPELPDIDKEKAAGIIDAALQKAGQPQVWLDAGSITGLLDCYGIKVVPLKLAKTPAEAVEAAQEIGFPVAVKLLSSSITQKTDVEGVILDCRTAEEVEKAFNRIGKNLNKIGRKNEMDGVIIQKMIKSSVEVIVGVTQHPSFGPLIMFGLGGIYVELFKDVTFSIHPLTDIDAHEMVRSVKAYQLLEGWRGSPRADISSIEDLILRISAMVEDNPQIMEMDLNPVKVLPDGEAYLVVDGRIMVCAESR